MPPSRNSRLGELDAALLGLRRFWSRPEVKQYYADRLRSDVQAGDYRTLRAIERAAERPSVGDVAAELRVDASTASRMINRVVKAGLCERTPSQEDARRTNLELTEAGRETLLELNRVRVAFLRELTGDWAAEEIATLAAMLRRLETALTGLGQGAQPDRSSSVG